MPNTLVVYGSYLQKERCKPSRMVSLEKKYKLTFMSAMKWAENELQHIGRIVAVEDPDIQYSYAMSTLYGMLHLKKALAEMVNDSAYSVHREDIQRTLDQVVRAIKHLIKDFSLDLNTIQAFNTKKILGDLTNVRPPTPLPVNVRPVNGVPANARPANARPANGRPANARPANGRPVNIRPANARSANGRPANVLRNTTRRLNGVNTTRSVSQNKKSNGLLGLGFLGL
jgi:hypothetical protein